MDMYEWGPEKRKKVGQRALEHALKDYDLNNVISAWDDSLSKLLDGWKNHKRWEIRTL